MLASGASGAAQAPPIRLGPSPPSSLSTERLRTTQLPPKSSFRSSVVRYECLTFITPKNITVVITQNNGGLPRSSDPFRRSSRGEIGKGTSPPFCTLSPPTCAHQNPRRPRVLPYLRFEKWISGHRPRGGQAERWSLLLLFLFVNGEGPPFFPSALPPSRRDEIGFACRETTSLPLCAPRPPDPMQTPGPTCA